MMLAWDVKVCHRCRNNEIVVGAKCSTGIAICRLGSHAVGMISKQNLGFNFSGNASEVIYPTNVHTKILIVNVLHTI